MTSRKVSVSLLLAVSLAFAPGCKKSEAESHAEGLPPATGKGAPPAAKLPEIQKDAPLPTAQANNDRTTATTYPLDEAKVGPKMTGQISKIWVKEGDKVKKGDPLFAIDSRAIALQRDQASAMLKSANVNLRSAEVEYQRMQTLFEGKATNQVQLEQSQRALSVAKIAVEQAQVGVAQANQALADATVRSPMAGVITEKMLSEGETATMMPPSIVVVVQDQSTLELRFRVPEKQLADMKPGKKLKAHFTAMGVDREAEIVRVSPSIDATTRTAEIIANIPNTDGTFRPGMLADVEMLP